VRHGTALSESGAAIRLGLMAMWLANEECVDAVIAAKETGRWAHRQGRVEVTFTEGVYHILVMKEHE
jgi:hypothetical protein